MASSLLEADALALGGCPPSAQAFLLTDDLPSPLGGAHKPAAAAAGQAHAGGMGSGGGAAAGPPLLAPSYAAHGSGLVPVGLAATPQLGLHGGMGLHGQQQQHQQQQHLLQQPWSGTAGSSFASDAPALTTFTNNPPSSGYLPHPYHPQLPLSQPMLPQPSQQQQYSYLQQQHHQQQQFYAQHHHHHQQQQLFLQQSQCFPYQTQQPYPAAMQQHHPQMPLQPQGLPQPSFPAHHQHLQQLQAHAQAPDRYSAQASGGSASSGASERRLYSLVRVDAATGALLREATEDDAREAARLIESDSSCSAIPGGGGGARG